MMIGERPSSIISRPSLSILGVLFYSLGVVWTLKLVPFDSAQDKLVLHLSHLMAQGSKSNHEKKSPALGGAKVLM